MKRANQTEDGATRFPRQTFAWLGAALLACALATPLLAEQTDNDNKKEGDDNCRVHVVRPDHKVAGKSYAEWAAEWWKWVLAIPADDHHPLKDEEGDDASRGQSGPVWFLGGVINVSGTAVRHSVVPTGKFLFFPILNVECSTLEGPPYHGDNEEQLRACAHSFGNAVLTCEIDGRPVANLANFAVTSPLFDFQVPANNVLGVAGPATGQAVDTGTYLMLRPLCPGQHTIHFRGVADSGFTLDITYHLTVTRPAAVFPPRSHPSGHAYEEWQANWWLWAMAMPLDGHHPLQDETGADAARGQSGPVWYLGGVFNSSGVATRNISVPSGKSLFIAIGNTECSTLEPAPFHGENEAQLRACAQGFVKNAAFCEIDGRPVANLERFDFTSALFNFTVPDNNVLGTPAGSGQAVDDGLYVMVPSLRVGQHTIRFGCTLADFPWTLDITYHITVTPRHR